MLPLKPRWTIAKLALATAAAVAVALPALTYPAMAAEAPTPKEQMLQSVSVSVGSNGAVRSIASSELSSAKKNGQAVGSHSFDPSKAAIDLPVRVKVAYKHDGKVGTNLRDLEGTNGRVEIDISVQNLLVRPKTLHFDSAGAAHSRTDLVGVPLTVVAAAKADFSPERVVMPERGGKGGTNGVLSQDESGKAAVQWASVLAPPQLSASTKLQFVVNAKDFEVPDLEINVQPGIVTDPSINSLLESTFDPAKSTEFKTVNNTVEMLAELNGTLAQAGDTISAARQSLSQSANAIGAKTIGDLKASNDHLVESAKSMISSTETMGQGLKQSLSGAQDGFNAQLGSSLAEIRNLLGNPEEAKPVRRVDSEGCAVTVDEQREPRSLFSNLQAVSAQLDEFASAAQSCKETTRQAFLELVGPENPTAEACESAPESVSCMLTDSKGRLRKIATGFEQNGNAALAALDPRTGADSVAAMKDLSDSVDQVGDRLEQLSLSDPVAKLHARSGPIKSAIVGAEHNLEDLRGYFNALHEKAVKQAENAGNAHTQVGELREEICKLTDGAVLPGEDAENSTEVGDGPLSRIQSDRLLRYLSERACGNQIDAKGRPLLIHKGKSGQSLETIAEQQQNEWQLLAESSDLDNTESGLATQIDLVASSLSEAKTKLKELNDDSDKANGELGENIAALRGAVSKLNMRRTSLAGFVTTVNWQRQSAAKRVGELLAHTTEQIAESTDSSIDPAIRTVRSQTMLAAEQMYNILSTTSAGLQDTAADITSNGRQMVTNANGNLTATSHKLAKSGTDQVAQNVSLIEQSVAASNRDMQATSAMLVGDISKVLLDLGSSKVHGSGLLGTMASNVAGTATANYQVADATRKSTAYQNVQSENLEGSLLRAAQTRAGAKARRELTPFPNQKNFSGEVTSVYNFSIEAN